MKTVKNDRSERRGRLLHGNMAADPKLMLSSPRCGAKTRRSGLPCRAPAMRNRKTGKYTRCRIHGGASTGPRTPEGLARSRKANWKHGLYSREEEERWRALRRETNELISEVRRLIASMQG